MGRRLCLWIKMNYLPQMRFAMAKREFTVNPIVSRKNLLTSIQTAEVYAQQLSIARNRLMQQQKCS